MHQNAGGNGSSYGYRYGNAGLNTLATTPPTEFSILQEAAEWFAVLSSGQADTGDRRRWRDWLDATPANAEAWQRVEAVSEKFNLLSPTPAREALSTSARQRRTFAKSLAMICVACATGATAFGTRTARDYLATLNAGHRTDIGQTRRLVLDDGTTVWLNTASAIDIEYTGAARRILLRSGEIMVQSAHDTQQPARPFSVHSPDGEMRALGTRFSVQYRDADAGTQLAMFEGAVRISPAGSAENRIIKAGQQLDFGTDWFGPLTASDENLIAWTRNLLMPYNMRLDDFLAELRRYRHGYLGCAPEVAALRLVGVYSLTDTDRVLETLTATLPIRIRRILPWWISVEAA